MKLANSFVQSIASSSKIPLLAPPCARGLASHAYHIPPTASTSASTHHHSRPSSDSSPRLSPEAVTATPNGLSPEHRTMLERTIRVDQAGELGANWIYRGQKLVMDLKGDGITAAHVEEMWATERHHLRTMDSIQRQHRVRPTVLYPLWKGAAMGLGIVTALMGPKAIMACTEAVETVIGEHYDDQIQSMEPLISKSDLKSSSLASSISTSSSTDPSPVHPSLPLLNDIMKEFRDDELEHLDTAVDLGAQMAPGHALLSAVVEGGCRGAIWVAARI